MILQTLAGGAAAALAGTAPSTAQQGAATTLVVILLDRDGSAGAGPRGEALDSFARQGIPVGYASGAALPFRPGTGVEPLLWSADALTLTRYFQARRLSDARAALAAGLTGTGAPWALAGPDPGGPLALAGLSPPGLRYAYLVPEESAPGWVESHPGRVAAARGGHLVRAGAGAQEAARAFLTQAVEDPAQVHATLYLDLAGPAAEVAELARMLAKAVAERIAAGHAVPLAPSELAARHTGHYQRLVGIRLDPPPGATPQEPSLVAMEAALRAAGIAYSVARDAPETLGPADVIRLDGADPAIIGAARGRLCAAVTPENPAAAPALAAAGIAAATGAAPPAFRGIDGTGLTHLGPVYPVRAAQDIEAMMAGLALAEDPIVAIDTEALALPALRNAALVALRRLAELAGTRLVDMAEYTTLIRAADALSETMRATRSAAPAIAARPAPAPDAPARAALMADARRAWAYFEATTNSRTGLPATTVAFTPEGEPGTEHDEMTQWDAGSAIFANVAAYRLGLVTPDDFATWRGKLLAALAASTLTAPRLPRATFDIGAPWRGSSDFNICDTARLLSALKALDRLSPDGDSELRALVAGWEFGAVLADGVAHSIGRGVPVPVDDTHCTSYIKHALGLWGYSVASQYDIYRDGTTEADAWMHLLTRVGEIGPFGAEPLLLEAVELGLDRPSQVLRDVLFAAQIARTGETGQLCAPSEGPMERPPWFTYQGLRVDHTGPKRWDVISLDPGGAEHTANFRDAVWMVTGKAAFLWAAAHPHPYSDRLLAYIRAHGALPTGFASGVYTATDAPTPGYSDVNTNGVILTAIARMLGSPA
ncbi:DUF3131 domain-containing protein [Sinisalibacter aestuarii]|uniref:DUF3131 domain-containing protein n=1 Tax=Sinisalibacter aestuarii TaxID=2949426 RepID=A0ABQ5LSW7_9RHOB|nr:DUF3131 domain-containing protein [Sinisalibacter aestuarii]GKY88058.1 hypothetical protein STA1M1_19270 [Sinisalibacter aestuarii]